MGVRQISLRHLRAFVAVAETGSFTVAASRVFQTQSSLTGAIQQFESALGMKLFDRTTRRVVMTEDAKRFLPIAEKILGDFDSAVSDLQAIAKSHKGHVRIAATASVIEYILTPALADFRQIFPETTFSIQDGGSAKIEQAVLDGQADFGIASRLRNYAELDYIALLRDPFGVVMPHDHPLARSSDPIGWAEFSDYECILLTNDTGIGAFMESYPELGLNPTNPYDYASSTTSLYAMLQLGGKISFLPALAAKAGPLKELKYREICGPTIDREICLITRHLRSFSLSANRILEVLMKTIQGVQTLHGARAAFVPKSLAEAKADSSSKNQSPAEGDLPRLNV